MAIDSKEKEKEAVKKITWTHDIINVVLIACLTFYTVYIYLTNDVNGDYEYQIEHGNEAKSCYIYVTAFAGIYTIYDLIFIIACK